MNRTKQCKDLVTYCEPARPYCETASPYCKLAYAVTPAKFQPSLWLGYKSHNYSDTITLTFITLCVFLSP